VRFLKHPATVIATVALFVAVGGGTAAYASGLISGSQIKNHSIPAKKLTKSAVKSLRGQRGPQGPQGVQGAQGVQGVQGPAGPFPSGNLPSGATVRGNFFMTGIAAASGAQAVDSLSFVYTLASAPTPHFITAGSVPPAGCPGTADNPQAAAGQLCVYEKTISGPVGTRDICGLDIGGSSCPGSNRWGAGVYELSTGTGRFQSYGTWAVAAP
jgi:hypothetical protein